MVDIAQDLKNPLKFLAHATVHTEALLSGASRHAHMLVAACPKREFACRSLMHAAACRSTDQMHAGCYTPTDQMYAGCCLSKEIVSHRI